jgi:flavin reductase (DIM6/NTAB) family NADH-FMN oxidoreductase RutF
MIVEVSQANVLEVYRLLEGVVTPRTLRNVQDTGEFVLNAAVESLAAQINLSSTELPRGASEVELAGSTTLPSLRVGPPPIAESPVHMECKALHKIPVENGPLAANLVVGEVDVMHWSDELSDGAGRVDPRKPRTIGRMGGDDYRRTTDLFEMPRPR